MPDEDSISAGYISPQLPLPPPPPGQPGGWGTEPRPQPDRRSRRRRVVAGALVVFVLLASGLGAGLLPRTNDASAPLPGRSSTGRVDVGAHASAIAAKVEPGIVDVNTVLGAGGSVGQPVGRGAGTGMILTSSGEVLTNNHVIQGATKIDISIPGRGGTYTATVLGADYAADVALLQIQGISGLSTVTLGDSSSVSTGQEVVAIGNALGKGGTPSVTEGTISEIGRSIAVSDDHGGTEHLTDMIQTSVPIQPGDSGGALVDPSGEVIGMITAGGQRVGIGVAPSSVGFAIPTSKALDIVNDIRAGNGSATLIIGQAGFLGVLVRPVDSATATRLGLNGTSGALVVGAIEGTPAMKAGIKQGSVITAIDDTQITSPETLGPALWAHRPGGQIRVTWVDQDGTHKVTVSLIAGPAV
ncbi:MAG: S1C family serine protease [Actinomycetota bacterium]|nr:S1C family serine protease [Actinomycetota bacterium]